MNTHGYIYDPALEYEVNVCGMEIVDNGDHTYCELRDNPDYYSTYVREYDGDGSAEILEDEEFTTIESATRRAEELSHKYGQCAMEIY